MLVGGTVRRACRIGFNERECGGRRWERSADYLEPGGQCKDFLASLGETGNHGRIWVEN